MPETNDWNAPLAQAAILSSASTFNAGEVRTTPIQVAGVAGRSIVVVGATMAPGALDNLDLQVRTLVQLLVSDNLTVYFLTLTISPEKPTDQLWVPPGTLVAGVGNPVAGQLVTEPGGGTQLISAAIYYFLQ